jgi:hypothetical protein
MDRAGFLKGAAWQPREPAPGARSLSYLPRIFGAAAAQTGPTPKHEVFCPPRCNARRSAAPTNASRLRDFSVQQVPQSAPHLAIDPGDLVERALQILAEEDEAWQARRGINLAPRSIR